MPRLAKALTMTILALMAWHAAGCKGRGSSQVKADQPDQDSLIEEIRATTRALGCNGCHPNMNSAAYKTWALKTADTAAYLAEHGSAADFRPDSRRIQGVYRVYPERFQKQFASPAEFQAFAQEVRLDPGMLIAGAQGEQASTFEHLKTLMLRLAASP